MDWLLLLAVILSIITLVIHIVIFGNTKTLKNIQLFLCIIWGAYSCLVFCQFMIQLKAINI